MLAQLIVVVLCASSFVPTETYEETGEERIVGGAPALHNEYPFIVSIQLFPEDATKGVKFCGGAIINKQWILTAAHCFKKADPILNSYYVNAGTNNAFSYSGSSQLIAIDMFYKHEKYHPKKGHNDICLLKLVKPLNFSASVNAIKLPAADYNPEIKGYGVIMGWGAVDSINHRISRGQLKKTIQDVMPQDKCIIKWPRLLDTQLCIYDKLHPSGDCAGDSGGPFIQYIDGIAYAVGVTSYGMRECGTYPSVYTRVSKYLDWINDTITEHSNLIIF